VTATITGSPLNVSFVGSPTAVTDGSGLATFSGLGLSGPVGAYTLTFTAGAVTSAASNSIVLGAGAATQLTYNTQPPANASSGAAFSTAPVLLLRDASNNPVSGQTVTATITGSPLNVSFVGSPTAVTDGSGLATFSGLGLSGPVGTYTLTFTAGALSSGASNSIVLGAGAATQLTYNTQPSTSATNGVAFAQQPILLLRDASNNPVSGQTVTATITGSPLNVSFVGSPTAVTDGSGLATFSGLGLSGPVGTYTLTFTAGAVSSAASNSIVLGAGAATQLAVTTQPSSAATNDVVLAQQPVVQLQDASGNAVSASGIAITAELVTVSGGPAVLGGTLTANTDSSGAAAFSDLKITGTAGTFRIKFTGTSLTEVLSVVITLSP
jgi:adhesin/invasin